MNRIQEKAAMKVNGWLALVVLAGACIAAGYSLLAEAVTNWESINSAITWVVGLFLLKGFVIIQPNEARVLTFFGKYSGTVKEDGFFWVNPFAKKEKVSLRIRNFESSKLKVNDAEGNPIEIGAVVVWKVIDSARAVYDVENYGQFVAIQSETAIRYLANHYPYDSHHEDKPSLRSATDEVGEILRSELESRLELAGVKVLEARISHLAYAPEIAQVMLRRQQAQAVVVARQQIVEGAMGMVEDVLIRLEKQGVVQLDEERKAAMVNNLMVALVSDGQTTPVINTGTLYA